MGGTVKKRDGLFTMHFHGGPQDGLVIGPTTFEGSAMHFPVPDKNGRWAHHVYSYVEFDTKSKTAKAVYGGLK